MPVDVTAALAGLGLWAGLALLFVGLMGPFVVRNPSHRRTFAVAIAVGIGLVLIASLLMVSLLGFGPDRAAL